MAYSSGMLDKRVTVARRVSAGGRSFGSRSEQYEVLGVFWASLTWNKGLKSLREGALDAYDTVMIRMRWREDIDRWCLIEHRGRWYQILSLNDDFEANQIQITAQEMAAAPEISEAATLLQHSEQPQTSDEPESGEE